MKWKLYKTDTLTIVSDYTVLFDPQTIEYRTEWDGERKDRKNDFDSPDDAETFISYLRSLEKKHDDFNCNISLSGEFTCLPTF